MLAWVSEMESEPYNCCSRMLYVDWKSEEVLM